MVKPFVSRQFWVCGRLVIALLSSSALTAAPLRVLADDLPTGGSVVSGQVSISAAGQGMTVSQGSDRAIVDWQGFSIGKDNSVNFVQPSSSSAILNRVTGSAPSTIAGSLTANGQVFIVNQNGIAITSTGTVKVGGGFVASTLDIDNKDFLSGNLTFKGNGASARVSNEGVISVGRGGYAALIGGTVKNSGLIAVPLGKVGLGSGEQATLDLSGDGFLQVAVPTKDGAEGDGALVENSGTIRAKGGTVVMKAATAREAARHAVNMSGTIEAKSVGGRNGAIVIGGGAGGKVTVSGKIKATSRHGNGGKVTITGRDIALKGAKIDVSGKTGGGTVKIGGDRQGLGTLPHAATLSMDAATTITANATGKGDGGSIVLWSDGLTVAKGSLSARGGIEGGNGGSIETSGHTVDFTGISVTTAAVKGVAGNWLIDPEDLTVNTADAATIQTNLASTGVTLQTTSTTASGTGTKTAGGAGDITINAPISWSANTTLTLDAYHSILVNATITAAGSADVVLKTNNGGSGGDLSFGLTGSGFTGKLDFTGTQGQQALSINGNAYTLVYSMGQLDAIDGASGVDNSAVTTYGTGLAGNYALAASLDASGTTYTQALVGTDSSSAFSGAFEGLGHKVSNLTISSSGNYAGLFGYATGTVRDIGVAGGTVSGANYVGGLVGQSFGTITNAYTTGAVSGTIIVGGLAGSQNGTITNSYATGAVNGSAYDVGGFVGVSHGTISNAYATGGVSGTGYVGGLVGYADGAITNSFATGAVNSSTTGAGGLVGYQSSGAISNSYATGAVSGNISFAGLVGWSADTISNSYWNTLTSGLSTGVGTGSSSGATGLTTTQMQNGSSASLGSAFTLTSGLYPYLNSLFPNGVQAVSGTLYGDVGSAPKSGVTVNVIANGRDFSPASSGANGYFYAFTPAGSFSSGSAILAYTSANATTGATNAATLISAAGTAPQTGLNLYANALTSSTNATTYSALPSLASIRSTYLLVSGSSAAANAAINGATGRALTTTGASFTVNQTVNLTDTLRIQTTTSGAGITVSNAVTVGNGASLSLVAAGALNINAPITVNGAGNVTLAYDQNTTTPAATDLSFGLTGTGFTGGLTYLKADGSAATSSQGGTLSINGTAYTLIYSMAQLDGIDGVAASTSTISTQAAGVGGHYAQAASLDASGINYTKALAGTDVSSVFSGAFEGLGHTISNLTINSGGNYASLFGYATGAVRDIGIVGGAVTTSTNNVGGLVSYLNGGTIANAYVTGTVRGLDFVGGLVGWANGTITNVYAASAVSGSSIVGGLVGSEAGGTIKNAYATGAVSGGSNVGGIAGQQTGGTINNVYATGAVSGTGIYVGSLVGIQASGTINIAYATGKVSGSSPVGGLVGSVQGTITNSYWDTLTSGISTGVGSGSGTGVTGLTTAQLQDGSSASLGSAFTVTSSLYPYLTSFFPNGIQVVSGTVYSDAGSTAKSGVTVNVMANGNAFASASSGPNGYYYAFAPAGGWSTGNSILSYTVTNATSGATNAATFAVASGAGIQTGVNLYANTLTESAVSTVASLSALNTLYTAAWGSSGALAGFDPTVAGYSLANRILNASAATFTVDAGLTQTGTLTLTGSAGTTFAASGSSATVNTGTFILTGGTWSQIASTLPSFSATDFRIAGGTFIRATGGDGSSATPYLLSDIYGMQGMGSAGMLGLNYTLTNNVDASGTSTWSAGDGWKPVGIYDALDSTKAFSGVLDGAGYRIINLLINRPTENIVGLFGYSSGTIQNIGVAGGTVSGNYHVGGLVGWQSGGTITNAYATNAISGSGYHVGGLVGEAAGAIANAYATGVVHGYYAAGGLVGAASGTITNAYATGAVSGAVQVGGLVGFLNSGSITNAYATGTINGANEIGGLVGNTSGSITNVYATGAVIGSGSYVGGLVGQESGGTMTSGYWNTTTSGLSAGVGSGSASGVTGQTTAQMQAPFTFIDAGFDFATVWGKSTSGANGGYMMLRTLSNGLYDDYVRLSGDTAKTYGDANPSLGGIAISGPGAANVVLDWGSAITAATGVGNYAYSTANVLSLSDNRPGKTVYADYGTGKLTIGQATLTVTANDIAKAFGTDAALTYTALGLKNQDRIGSVTLSSAGAAASAAFGTYPIVVGNALGTGLENYRIIYMNGRLDVGFGAGIQLGSTLGVTGGTNTSGSTTPPWSIQVVRSAEPGDVTGSLPGTGGSTGGNGSQSQSAVIVTVANPQVSDVACVLSVNTAIACSAGASSGR